MPFDLRVLPQSSSCSGPGGQIRRPLKDGVTGPAKFGGKNKEYRYPLSRIWDVNKPHALLVLMNPSTADCSSDDPTVAKCQVFAKGWGATAVFTSAIHSLFG